MLDLKTKIQQIVNSFESGSKEGDYGCISLYEDGPNKIKQITYGKSQTTEWGNLRDLIKMYIDNNGKYAYFFLRYVDGIGVKSLVNDSDFILFLRKAAQDPIMHTTQDAFFDKHYWNPAMKWCDENKFILNLSKLVIYDSFIQSGSILKFLRNKFAEKIPLNGGDEKKWIFDYCEARLNWLQNHENPDVRKSSYRVKNLITAIKGENWDLSKNFLANGEEIS
jgi:chitosanase